MNLAKYWVLSMPVQYSIRQISAIRIGVAIVAATIGLLLAFAASAKAEGADAVTTTLGALGGSSASTEPAPPPTETAEPATPADTPEPAEAENTEEASSAAESESAPVSRPASPDLPSASTLASTRTQVEAAVPDSLRSKVQEVNATPTSTNQVAELAGRIRHDAAKSTASVVHFTGAAAQVVDRAAPLNRVRELVSHPLQLARDGLQGGLVDLLVPDSVETSLQPTGVDVGTPSPLHHAAPRLPNALPTGADLRYRATIIDGFLMHPLAETGGVEPARLGSPNALGDPSWAPADAIRDFASLGERSKNVTTFERNVPSPSPTLPDAIASGLGSSSFVPVVALLALLALVVPAIFRRLREVPGFRAPLPFVCVLERPG